MVNCSVKSPHTRLRYPYILVLVRSASSAMLWSTRTSNIHTLHNLPYKYVVLRTLESSSSAWWSRRDSKQASTAHSWVWSRVQVDADRSGSISVEELRGALARKGVTGHEAQVPPPLPRPLPRSLPTTSPTPTGRPIARTVPRTDRSLTDCCASMTCCYRILQ